MVLEILFKRFEQNINLENGKGFLFSLPVSGSAHFSSSPPGLPISPFPLLSRHGPARARPSQRQRGPLRGPIEQPASRASSPLAAAADKAVPLPRATARQGPPVGPVPYLVSEPDTSRTATARVVRASCPPSARFRPFKYSPRSPLAPQFIPSRSRRVKLAQVRRRDPHHHQSAAAASSRLHEQLAGLRNRLAKSPELSFLDFVHRAQR